MSCTVVANITGFIHVHCISLLYIQSQIGSCSHSLPAALDRIYATYVAFGLCKSTSPDGCVCISCSLLVY